MQITESQNGIPSSQSIRESTHIIQKNGRSGVQQYFDNGFGKVKNIDFEPMHYSDN
ncbi:hypothetical protein [Anaerotignum sp.]|nr:hypothetical protein [Anaerotignum sp.]MBO5329607.1 hypothetical protein [Anaerotignum sp.]MBP3305995.1 hypothetical protein [Anaerotignum sp.]MBP3629460.1 hypothetical protein [Anaerotignum sp.]